MYIYKVDKPFKVKLNDEHTKSEWINLDKVSYIRLPTYTEPCYSCQTRWGAYIVVDGHEVTYSEEAEVKLRKLLNVP